MMGHIVSSIPDSIDYSKGEQINPRIGIDNRTVDSNVTIIEWRYAKSSHPTYVLFGCN